MKHTLEPVVRESYASQLGLQPPTPAGHRCAVCGQTWKTEPSSDCPGVKVYRWDPWPDGLYTEAQVRAKGLRPGPVAGVIARHKSPDGWMKLYRLEDAKPKRQLNDRQRAALDKMRQAETQSRTCTRCGQVWPRGALRDYYDSGKCVGHICPDCKHLMVREEASAWAREVLADAKTAILDCETTGLHAGAEVLQIAVIDAAGIVLLDTLVKPEQPIIEASGWDEKDGRPASAYAVHGIGNAAVAGAPRFPAMYARLAAIVAGRRLIVYNAPFDRKILRFLARSFGLPELEATWECAMEMYARWYGDWSERHRDYRWQPLRGGDHTALGDCRATLDALQEMAANKPDGD